MPTFILELKNTPLGLYFVAKSKSIFFTPNTTWQIRGASMSFDVVRTNPLGENRSKMLIKFHSTNIENNGRQ